MDEPSNQDVQDAKRWWFEEMVESERDDLITWLYIQAVDLGLGPAQPAETAEAPAEPLAEPEPLPPPATDPEDWEARLNAMWRVVHDRSYEWMHIPAAYLGLLLHAALLPRALRGTPLRRVLWDARSRAAAKQIIRLLEPFAARRRAEAKWQEAEAQRQEAEAERQSA